MTATSRVNVMYRAFPIWDDDDDPEELEASTGLVAAWATGGVVVTGVDTGSIEVTVQPLTESPGEPSSQLLDEWEDVAEVDLVSSSGSLCVGSYAGDDPDLPDLAGSGPGTYRLRVYAWGRDLAYRQFGVDSPERFLLQCWLAAEPSPPRLLKASDDTGRIERDGASFTVE